MSFPLDGLGSAWVVGGGYKYLQLGEGNCFLRVPPHGDELRPPSPAGTEFAELAAEKTRRGRVPTGRHALRGRHVRPDDTTGPRASSTSSRAGPDPSALRENYLRQTTCWPMHSASRAREDYGGFVAVEVPDAEEVSRRLAARRDDRLRGAHLRLGPAPYLTDDQLERAVGAVRRYTWNGPAERVRQRAAATGTDRFSA